MSSRNIITWTGFVLIALTLPGCAAVRCFPNNNMCSKNVNGHCNHVCNDGPEFASVAEAIPQPHPVEAMQVAHWEELSTVQEQLATLAQADASLQEQLALLDSNAEQQRQDRQVTEKRIEEIASKMSAMRSELTNYKDDIQGMESSLMQQREEHEQVLASVERQLLEVLREYR